MAKKSSKITTDITVRTYGEVAIPHLYALLEKNEKVMERVTSRLVRDVKAGRSLLVFGSGHSGIFPMELYHRAGGASFVVPLFADYLLPTAGPPVVRVLERTAGSANFLLNRVEAKKGEMLWLSSNSGINAAVVDLALEAKRRGLFTVAFTSVTHSSAVASRHASGKRLFEVCDETVDIGGFVGDASIQLTSSVSAGPLSTLSTVLLGHSIVVAASAQLEVAGVPCVYTSVNTPDGEKRNRKIEEKAMKRDFLLR